jgi:hypothetical protein
LAKDDSAIIFVVLAEACLSVITDSNALVIAPRKRCVEAALIGGVDVYCPPVVKCIVQLPVRIVSDEVERWRWPHLIWKDHHDPHVSWTHHRLGVVSRIING